jgi:hypothetical protein
MAVRFQFWLVLLLLTACAQESFAWGWQGHKVIGLIADRHLKPEVRELILEKFSINSLADVASWADKTRKKRKEEGPWHYTNIAGDKYNAQRDCPDGACVTEKIHEFSGVLLESSASLRQQKDALKFLVHFVGDVHQPLHLGNKKDRGGSTLRFPYKGKIVSLHYLWDGGLIDWGGEPESGNMFILRPECVDGLMSHCAVPPSLGGGEPLLKHADRLHERVSEAEEWYPSTVSDWADESRSLALKEAYKVDGLSKVYIKRSREIINLRLTQAGVRLAHLLNKMLTTAR